MKCYHDVIEYDKESEEWYCVKCGDVVPAPEDEDSPPDLGITVSEEVSVDEKLS